MIPTLRILAERVIRDLSGGDIPNDSPYDIDYVIEHVRDAIAEALKLEILSRRQGDEDDRVLPSQFISTHVIEVQFDEQTNRSFAVLPQAFMSLKYNIGIRSVSKVKGSLHAMIPVGNPSAVAHTAQAALEGQNYAYYNEGLKIFWFKNILEDEIKNVLVKLYVSVPEDLTADDPLPLLPEQIAGVLDRVKARVQNRVIQDRLNDNNPNIRNLNEQQK